MIIKNNMHINNLLHKKWCFCVQYGGRVESDGLTAHGVGGVEAVGLTTARYEPLPSKGQFSIAGAKLLFHFLTCMMERQVGLGFMRMEIKSYP